MDSKAENNYHLYDSMKTNLQFVRDDQMYHQSEIINIFKYHITIFTGLISIIILTNQIQFVYKEEILIFLFFFMIPASLNIVHNLYLKILYKTVRNCTYLLYLENLINSTFNFEYIQLEHSILQQDIDDFKSTSNSNSYPYSLLYNLIYIFVIDFIFIAISIFIIFHKYNYFMSYKFYKTIYLYSCALVGLSSCIYTMFVIYKVYNVYIHSESMKNQIHYRRLKNRKRK